MPKYRVKVCPECGKNPCAERSPRCVVCAGLRRAERLAGGVSGIPGVPGVPGIETISPAESLKADQQESRLARELRLLRERYAESLKSIEQYQHELRTVTQMQNGLETYTIEPTVQGAKGEATVIVVASDWHIEERVGAEVGGLNTFNDVIAAGRINKFFQKAHSLTELLSARIEIPTMVLALLGDFISNDIHDELAEQNGELPMHAIVSAQNYIISGIEYLLRQAPHRQLVLPCHSGNHARTTKTTRFGSENGHSLEYLLYQHLAAYFRADPRVSFVIAEGPHSYLDIYGQTVRFQHGHMIKYGGGVGGIYIPTHKAIAQWNRARHADLDIFGHFHQLVDGGNFVCNGSLVGYNSFALSIKAAFEKPKQTLLLMDAKRGRTCLWPIYL